MYPVLEQIHLLFCNHDFDILSLALTRLQQFKLRDTSNDDHIIKQQLLMKLTQLEDVVKVEQTHKPYSTCKYLYI